MVEAEIRKLKREGVAPNGCSLRKIPVRCNCYEVKATQPQYSLPNGNRSLYVGSPDDSRYKEWAGLIQRRNLLREYEGMLKVHKQIDARLDAKKTKAGHTEGASVEWYTPPEYLNLTRTVLGDIDLDPASNTTAQEWIKAGQFYGKEDDGLAQPWAGRVWCNPPYGKFSRLFMERGLQFYKDGAVTACIFLVNRTGAAWYVDLAQQFDAVCQVRKRINFYGPNGEPEGSPRYYNDFLYLGPDVEKFVAVFSPVGRLSR